MKNLLLAFFLCSFFGTNAQTIFGKWKTIDDHSGEEKSIVKIYETEGKAFGDVLHIYKESERDKLCTRCEGDRKNKKIEGMTIIQDMEKVGNQYVGGTVLDPGNGKEYKAKIWLNEDNPNILNVRGYVGIFYRTQNWVRMK